MCRRVQVVEVAPEVAAHVVDERVLVTKAPCPGWICSVVGVKQASTSSTGLPRLRAPAWKPPPARRGSRDDQCGEERGGITITVRRVMDVSLLAGLERSTPRAPSGSNGSSGDRGAISSAEARSRGRLEPVGVRPIPVRTLPAENVREPRSSRSQARVGRDPRAEARHRCSWTSSNACHRLDTSPRRLERRGRGQSVPVSAGNVALGRQAMSSPGSPNGVSTT